MFCFCAKQHNDVLMVAANREELLDVIDLVGLQTTGVEYVPYSG